MHTDKNLGSTWLLLKWTFGLVPIVAGLDKFFNILADWQSYVSPAVSNVVPAATLIAIVGVIEIAAGLLVLSKYTKVGAYVVSAWLVLIAVNLLLLGQFDLAVRDVVMAIATFSLGQLSE